MENEFDKYPKVSIDLLLKEGIVESIDLTENELGHMMIELSNDRNISVKVYIGKQTAEKLQEDINRKTTLSKSGHIALISSGTALNDLRFYTSAYTFLEEFLNFEEKEILNKEKDKIKKILKNHL